MNKSTEKQHTVSYSLPAQIAAWSVHAFTSSGVVFAFLAILAVANHDWRMAMIWLLVCYIVDGIDGTFARLFKVKEVLPYFDGKSVDYVIDFATYAIIPTYFMYEAGIVPEHLNMFAAASMLMVSAYYYGKSGMVSDDYHFVGFPVLWNFVVFYQFFVFDFSPMVNFIAIMVLCVLHIVPIKYIYPSRSLKYQVFNIVMTTIGIASFVFITWFYPEEYLILQLAAIATMIHFIGMSLIGTFGKNQLEDQ